MVQRVKVTERKQNVVLTGVVTPLSWDDDGKVLDIGVATADERDYVVRRGSATEELSRHLRGLVRIKGVLRKEDDGRGVLAVQSFEALDKPSSWERWD